MKIVTHCLVLCLCGLYLINPARLISADWELASTSTLGVTSKLCVAESGTIFLYDRDSLWKSNNGGRDWTKLKGVGFTNNIYHMFELDGMIYASSPAGSAGTGIFRSDDDGLSFSLASAVKVASGVVAQVVASANRVFAVSNRTSVFWSIDKGVTFTEVAVPTSVGSIVDFAADNDNWVASGTGGVMLSTDAGTMWTQLPSLPTAFGAVQHVEFLNSVLVVGANFGMLIWKNGAWVPLNGLPIGAGFPAAIQDMVLGKGLVYVVGTQWGGVTGVYTYSGNESTIQQLGTTTFPSSHGAARGMLRVNSKTAYLHYVHLTSTPRGTYSIQAPTSGVQSDRSNFQNDTRATQTNSISLHPNPTLGPLTISSTSPTSSIQIFTLHGVCVFHATSAASLRTILNLDHLSVGTYMVVVDGATKPLTKY